VRESDQPEPRQQEALEGLRAAVAASRAARERLVLAADANLRGIERELHGGVQQHLVALAMRLQLADLVIESDPPVAKALLEEMREDVQQAHEAAARLAQRIYAPLPELGGLAVILRSAAVNAGTSASVDVASGTTYPPEIVHTVYACWLAALDDAGDRPPAITVREHDGTLAFELVGGGWADERLDAVRDRVEALGGRLTLRSERDGSTLVSGSLPLAR
jgi:signal transduction histidine kinase